ncbi:hypothetical protein O181_013253 [Austropuccinia psidii MF-1]|uniref:Uncharacterized protein n=1 Tax=Austropuccinia psidii MF-1 TaxID=1389203 RepID=A0A9Q3BYC0_9BASI|nr:hypothetical protein [Austropuccinia psidii MF-1]
MTQSLNLLAENIRLLRLPPSTCIYVHLLGGLTCFTTDDAYDIEYNCDEERFLLKNYQSDCMTRWCNGFGHIFHLYPPELGTHGYVPIAKFLQLVVPKYKDYLYRDTGGKCTKRALVTNMTEKGSWNNLSLGGTQAFASHEINTTLSLTRARPNGMPTPPHKGGGTEGVFTG